MKDIVLFGVGENFKYAVSCLAFDSAQNVIEIWDNDIKKQGLNINVNDKEVIIKKPHLVSNDTIIVIVSDKFAIEMKNECLKLGIPEHSIKHWLYCADEISRSIVAKYENSKDRQLQATIAHIKNHGLQIYNHEFYEKYHNKENDIEIHSDERTGLLYSFWKGKKVYLKRNMTLRDAKRYMLNLFIEQDKDSPHHYPTVDEMACVGVCVDAGAAEGIFALERIDNCQKVYIIESDAKWVEALEETFAPYRDKVRIINKFLSDKDDDKNITLDSIAAKGDISLVKMDIEGYECDAVRGAESLINKDSAIIFMICTYHKSEDADILSKMMLEAHFSVRFTDGYMFFPYGETIEAELRHCLLIARKK